MNPRRKQWTKKPNRSQTCTKINSDKWHPLSCGWPVWRYLSRLTQDTCLHQSTTHLFAQGPPSLWFWARFNSSSSQKETLCFHHHSPVSLPPHMAQPHGSFSQISSKNKPSPSSGSKLRRMISFTTLKLLLRAVAFTPLEYFVHKYQRSKYKINKLNKNFTAVCNFVL